MANLYTKHLIVGICGSHCKRNKTSLNQMDYVSLKRKLWNLILIAFIFSFNLSFYEIMKCFNF